MVTYLRGVNLLHFLNPSTGLKLAGLLKTAYRNCLVGAIMVDMIPAFEWFMNLCLKAMPAETAAKFKFCTYEESLIEIERVCEPEFLKEYKRYTEMENEA